MLPLMVLLPLLDGFHQFLPRSLEAVRTDVTFSETPATTKNVALYVQERLQAGYDPIIEALVQQYPVRCHDKERLLEILLHSGLEVSLNDCMALPKWSEVTDLYGDVPVVYGLDTCERYQQIIAGTNGTIQPAPRVAGLYNTGTNALAQSFNINFQPVEHYHDQDVPGGKHVAPTREYLATYPDMEGRKYVLPVTLIRDPFRWLQSMCRDGYAAKWSKGIDGRCPNLVLNAREKETMQQYSDTFPVNVSMKNKQFWDHYDSLSHMYSTWYRLWLDADYPRLIIRFEDTLFHADQVTALIAKCAGLDFYNASAFKYHVEAAKNTKTSTSFTQAMGKYGRAEGRYNSLEPQDIEYLRTSIDPKLLQVFNYKKAPWNETEMETTDIATVDNSLADAESISNEQEMNDAGGHRSTFDLIFRHPNCKGKERLLEILQNNGYDEFTANTCEILPTWKEVTELYGEEPVVYGLDSCERYRYQISAEANGGTAHAPAPRATGLCNAGTDMLEMALHYNAHTLATHAEHDHSGGKQFLASRKFTNNQPGDHTLKDTKYIMPIVVLRDPLRWMNSLCRAPTVTTWQRGEDVRCPNLVPSDIENLLLEYQHFETFNLMVDRNMDERNVSLADIWTDWNMEYANAAFPRLMVRVEDLLFHAEKVTQLVAQCVGMDASHPYRYPAVNAKQNADAADIFAALTEIGRKGERHDGFLANDIEYASKALDPQLLRVFQYPSVVTPKVNKPTSSADKKGRDVSVDVNTVVSRLGECSGKEELVAILIRAGLTDITKDHCVSLPTWEEVAALYGHEPVVYGRETCARYRRSLSPEMNNGTAIEPAPRVAGLFNTGTNALAQSLSLNFEHIDDHKLYNVASRKHVPARDRWLYDTRYFDDFTIEELRRSLPIALVRDPYRWMRSMCKNGYNAAWSKGVNGRCPNLIPTEQERQLLQNVTTPTFEVNQVIRDIYQEKHESLATFWSDWNRLYLDTFRPRLMIRFEDLLFHPEKVMQIITDCVGVSMKNPYKYVLDSVKNHGDPADFVTALAKYGRADGRFDGLTADEAIYLQTALDPELMNIFGYKQIPIDAINEALAQS
ncbi:hypothetical protein MPSEU_000187300 [Mayamaea pseudoterrestris]|nr:hypothetical protein MPSEU_000187300 [Mayamaea pseudoterrestris]